MVRVSDIVTITVGPMMANTWPLSDRMLGIIHETLTAEQQTDLEMWAEHMAKVHPRGLSTPEETAEFFADRVTTSRSPS